MRPVARSQIIGAAGAAYELNAFTPMRMTMEANAADVEVLAIGDSMSDNQNEVFGTWAAELAKRYPKYTVNWITWNDAGGVYDAPTLIRAGTGSRTLNIYNACVASTRCTYLLGTKYAAAIAARNPSLVIFLHGLNHVGAGVFANMIRGEVISALEEIRTSFPTANLAWIVENPKRDDTLMESVTPYGNGSGSVSIKQILDREHYLQPDLTIVDAYSKFILRNKDTGLYSDATHGNTALGISLYLEALMQAWDRAKPGTFKAGQRLFGLVGTNQALNGDFASFASSPPTSWTLQNAVTAAKELTNVDQGHPWACRITAGATGAPFMRQLLGAQAITDAIAAGFISVATRMFRPTGAAGTVGRPNVFIGGATQTGVSLRADTEGQGRYWWRVQPDIPIGAAASSIQINTYADTAGAGMDTTHPTDIDRIVVVLGSQPRNM